MRMSLLRLTKIILTMFVSHYIFIFKINTEYTIILAKFVSTFLSNAILKTNIFTFVVVAFL